MNEIYHYTECGLPDIYLKNGFCLQVIDNEEYLSIDHIESLHQAIGLSLAGKHSLLTGDEFRFLRIELNQSRRVLGELLGVDQQTIGRWEKGESAIPKLADVSVRVLFSESCHQHSQLGQLLEQLAEAEAQNIFSCRMEVEEKNHVWHVSL
ncbi:helix-turn-helix domain-containing protein [Vibrio quintilis]|uniref:HTH cro/C1-type domain-containing protein n=1 Tax=Vibrio quintilis TaxID=1117707 RepID=A0A1M7Z0P8_9VIBR|nr:helix-turn-helix domain-containing protein [Vibrio quintilis]SHO58413.1 hypothetical protein VQ7734_04185 [Vibrio quintilis]